MAKRTPLQKPELKWKVSKEDAALYEEASNLGAKQRRVRKAALMKELDVLKNRILRNDKDNAAWIRLSTIAAELGAPNIRGPQKQTVTAAAKPTTIAPKAKKGLDTSAIYAELNRSK